MKKFICLILVPLIVLSLGLAALASGEASTSGEASGNASGEASGGASGESSTFGKIEEQAGVVVKDGVVTYAEGWAPETPGEITATGAKGVVAAANEANGLAITMAEETDVYVIEDCEIYADAGQKNAEAGLGGGYGVGVGIRTGELWIKNSRISTEGSQATAVFMESTAKPNATSLVVVDSEITAHSDRADVFIPPFKLLFGASRAIMLMPRNNSWFINSSVTSSNWGAYSQDSIDAISYLINSTGAATEGGYAAYLTYGLKLYASQLYGAQYGVFMAGDSIIETGSAADALADADAMSKTPDYVPTEQPTIIAAPFNVIVVHTSTPGLGRVAVGRFEDAILSTMPEDLPDTVTPMAADDEFFMDPDEDSYGVSSGAAYFYNRNLYGSLILVRSMNTDFTFDNTDARSSNGVLVQTVINYDPPDNVGYLSAGQGENYPGVSVTFKNGAYKGDILHQDYQRRMTVTVGEDSVLEGAVVSGTWKAWNDLWSEESLLEVLKEDGYAEIPFARDTWAADVQENLTLADDAAYAETENLGADVEVSAGGTWIVTDTSTLSSLTLEDGAVLTAPEGMTLTAYVNADASNANCSYEGGTQLDELAPGTYDNVIIMVSEASAEPLDEIAAEAEKRSLPLEGVANAWQLGGYVTEDGKKVRDNALIRSGTLSNATEEDIKTLSEVYHLTAIVDFRSSMETLQAPDPEIPGTEYVSIAMEDKDKEANAPATLAEMASVEMQFSDEPGRAMVEMIRLGWRAPDPDMYITMITSAANTVSYRAFLDTLLAQDEDSVVLYHCRSGKDRTGTATMLILTILGVDEETILDDFEITNHFLADEINTEVENSSRYTDDPDELAAVRANAGVTREFMARAFDYAEEQCGSMLEFIKQQYSVTDEEIARLRELYLTD